MPTGRGIGISPFLQRSGKVVYSPGATAFFAQLPTQPNTYVKSIYNTLFLSGMVDKGDRFYIRGSQYQDNALVSLANPTSTITSLISSPTWFQYMGFTGATSSALNWNFTPSTDAVQFTQNAGAVFIWCMTDLISNNAALGVANAGEDHGILIKPKLAPDIVFAALNSNGSYSSGSGNSYSVGLITVVRTDSTTFKIYKNITLIRTVTGDSSRTLSAFSMYELAFNVAGVLNTPYLGEIYASGIGNWLESDIPSLYSAINNFQAAMPINTGIGDSIIYGYPNTNATSWFNLLATYQNKAPRNMGVNGQSVTVFNASGVPIPKYIGGSQQFWTDYLANDSLAGPSGVAAYSTQLGIFIDNVVAAGWPISKIKAISNLNFIDGSQGYSRADMTTYSDAAKIVYATKGVQNFDLSGLTYTTADGIHPDIPGDATIFNYLKLLV